MDTSWVYEQGVIAAAQVRAVGQGLWDGLQARVGSDGAMRLLAAAAVLYLIPPVVVLTRRIDRAGLWAAISLLLGWTGIVWLGCLALACLGAPPRRGRPGLVSLRDSDGRTLRHRDAGAKHRDAGAMYRNAGAKHRDAGAAMATRGANGPRDPGHKPAAAGLAESRPDLIGHTVHHARLGRGTVIELDWLNGVAGILFEQDGRLHMVDLAVLKAMNPGLQGAAAEVDRLAGMRI